MINAALENLRWKSFDVLDDGQVALVDAMGSDSAIVQAARVSYGEGTKHISDDTTLIRYLMRHRHTTPFEMCEVKLRVRVPMDCWRQWIRHRMVSVNEYSTRYSKAIDSQQKTAPGEWRIQATANKQGSGGFLPVHPDSGNGGDEPWQPNGLELTNSEAKFHEAATELYKQRLEFGVAREQARKDLPLSTYTEAYWKIDLHNLLHFLSLRMDSHAQLEIRSYATIIGEQIVAKLFPITWQAFLDYRVNALSLTALEIGVIEKVIAVGIPLPVVVPSNDSPVWPKLWQSLERCRERDECIAKFQQMKIFC
jgi:thymidylate synthase (FAD)